MDLYNKEDFNNVQVSFVVTNKFISKNSIKNLYIPKNDFIKYNLMDHECLINYIKEDVNKHLKKNSYELKNISICPENERSPF